MSSKNKKILFSDDEDNSEELKANFEKALNKKQFGIRLTNIKK